MKKKQIIISAALGAGVLLLLYVLLTAPFGGRLFSDRTPAQFRTSGRQLQLLRDGQWVPFEIRGVNMGSGCPGSFPNEGGIDGDAYDRWFELIGEMHANTVRVYKLQTPEFYAALARYNERHEKKLYLIQTIDFPEHLMYSEDNVMDPEGSRELFEESRRTVDALHGDRIALDPEHDRLQCYLADVSDYVLGYLFGIEWDEIYVEYIDRMNPGAAPFQGTYLSCTAEASPFESFLCMWGEALLSYEAERYGEQKLVSFCNWPDTDPFANELQLQTEENKLVETNLEVQVDVEHIRAAEQLTTGVFASYNIYPYYPLFLQYGEYTNSRDDTGRTNPYRGYLSHLVQYHSCPVLVSEYGLPASRSKAHDDIWRGFTHGGLNEVQQGQGIAAMYEDTRKAGCAGSLLFSWQDEWYKRTWNELMISDPDGRASWCNVQSSEQMFGLLSFDPASGTGCYPDGELSEWAGVEPVVQHGGVSLRMQSDEAYVYFLVEGYDPAAGLTVALDLLPGAGVQQQGARQFERPVDFLLCLNGREQAELLVHDDYSLLVYSMSDKMHAGLSQEVLKDLYSLYHLPGMQVEHSQEFHVVQRASGSIYSYLRHVLDVDPVGRLKRGSGNPASPHFDSNADYCISGSSVELRIPWQLLNFRDPSRCMIVDALMGEGQAIRSRKIDAIYVSLCAGAAGTPSAFGEYELTGWKKPHWNERPKASYYILQKVFEGAEKREH